jgi:uncharacterized repeat protein (TIGR03803 family)
MTFRCSTRTLTESFLRLVTLLFCAAILASCGGTVASPIPATLANGRSDVSVVRTQPGGLTQDYRVLFSFGSNVYGDDGAYPMAGLIKVNGTLYGTTEYGGSYGATSYVGYGTIFGISVGGAESALYSFSGGADGAFPTGGLIYAKGRLCGTASAGGAYGDGTVFCVNLTGKSFRVLHAFRGGATDGADPMAAMVKIKEKLYGTTAEGGAYGGSNYSGGTVFSVDMATSKEQVIHSFGGSSDGAYPLAGLIDVKGTLYGTTEEGGDHDAGTVFAVSTAGMETVLFRFSGSLPAARHPVAGLIAMNGTLYGTTYGGGSADYGTVFSVNMNGTNERVLHSFTNNGADGIRPYAGLTAVKGALFGTTYNGGTACRGSKGSGIGCGTIFRVKTSGEERVLHSFGEYYKNDGLYPAAALMNVNATLYGTTVEGGIELPSCPHSGNICDYGTVFALSL